MGWMEAEWTEGVKREEGRPDGVMERCSRSYGLKSLAVRSQSARSSEEAG
jgi:hypothetical protein